MRSLRSRAHVVAKCLFIVATFALGCGRTGPDPQSNHAKTTDLATRLATADRSDAALIEATSDLLRHPEDDRTKMVFAPNIRGATDRFLIRARKPE